MALPVRLAIVGIGVIGRSHVNNALTLQSEGLLDLVGLADIDIALAHAASDAHGIPVFGNAEEVLDQARPTLLLIATPHPQHEAATIAAAQRGVHVLCEKPFAHTVSAADRMIAACQSAGVMLGIDFQQRTTPSYIKAQQIIHDGQLGDLYHVSFVASGWYRTQAYYDSGGWRGTWDGEGGGVIMNQAPHHLDLYCWLAGLPRRIKASALTRTHDIDVENTVSALLEHGPERVDSFYTTTAEWPGRTELNASTLSRLR
ncbi:MAG: Gfo/Idh/MocA family oxidoreductase [Chloroflexi bacterium]|nr:Gfo/Idh/MocA family oxidoreductase [Chloroflexota bacterium]